MSTENHKILTSSQNGRRTQDIDHHVGNRMRERRLLLGLSQQDMATLIGVTYQQAHKYERGVNRVAAGRLYKVSQVLGVPVEFFFEGLERDQPHVEPTQQQRLLLELARLFAAVPERRHQEALCSLARALAMSDVPVPVFEATVQQDGQDSVFQPTVQQDGQDPLLEAVVQHDGQDKTGVDELPATELPAQDDEVA